MIFNESRVYNYIKHQTRLLFLLNKNKLHDIRKLILGVESKLYLSILIYFSYYISDQWRGKA